MRKIHFIILCIIAMLAISCMPGKKDFPEPPTQEGESPEPEDPFFDTVVPPNNPPIISRDGLKRDSIRPVLHTCKDKDWEMIQIKDTQLYLYMIDSK